MSVYDKHGNLISGAEGDLKEAFLELVASGEINVGSTIGQTLVYRLLSDEWIANATTAYNSMLAKYKELSNQSIPFFISTDQHSGGLEQHRWVNNIDTDGLEMANINMGDTVLDYFSTSALEMYANRVKLVKNFIGIVGNHDAKTNDNTTENEDLIPNVYDLTRYFNSTYDRDVANGRHASYTVIDHEHNVRYLASDNYRHTTTGQMIDPTTLSAEYCEWLIGELSKDDYDLIMLQHWYLHSVGTDHDEYVDRNGEHGYYQTGAEQLRTVMLGRKNKTSGTITDVDGGTHAFDFRNMKHDLLCMLSGHAHHEYWANLDGLLCYVADWYNNNGSCVFGLVDRASEKLRIWKFDSTAVYDELVLDI